MELVGKRVKIIFNDGKSNVTKIGTVVLYDSMFLFLKGETKEEGLPISNIIRMEVLE